MSQLTSSELSPAKWKKYLVLALFGLASEENLIKSILRFPFNRLDDCKSAVLATLAREGPKKKAMIVVKLVSLHQSQALPNYIVTCADDVTKAFASIEKRSNEGWIEIWYCLNDVSTKTFSVGGRFIPDDAHGGAIQVLEQVWHTSPRMIEEIGGGLNFPYLRADRIGFTRRLEISEIFIPQGYPITKDRVVDEYQRVLRFLKETEESWTPLVAHILGKGVSTISLEYKVNDGIFSFIDWDTEDDDKVL